MLTLLLLACAAHQLSLTPSAPPCDAPAGPALERRLDRRTDSELRQGNAVELLVNGAESFPLRTRLAREADLILVKTFIFEDDEVGRQVATLLAERAAAGATVVLQYDIKGSTRGVGELIDMADDSGGPSWLKEKPLFRRLREAGVIVVPTNVPRSERGMERWLGAEAREKRDIADVSLFSRLLGVRNLGHFDHEKYWITGVKRPDGTVELSAILGGLNIASEYAYGGTPMVDSGTGRGGWRDTDVAVRGPAALDVYDRYCDLLARNLDKPPRGFDPKAWRTPQPRSGDAEVRFVWNQPAFGNRRSVERLYRILIDATPSGAPIHIVSAYFTPGRRLREPLQDALRRDVPLSVLTNSPESVDVPFVVDASRSAYAGLARVSEHALLYEWIPQPERGAFTMHAKTASFGTCGPVVIGSANLDGLSSERNSESVVMVRDPGLRADFDASLADDFSPACAAPVAEKVLEGSALPVRIWRRFIYATGWTWL